MAPKSTKVPRTASKAFLIAALIVGGLFLAAGVAATATNALAPFVRGHDFAAERHLSRDTVALAVHVGYLDEAGEPRRAEGAVITLSRVDIDTPVATGSTDSSGRVIFHLRPGGYHGVVEFDGMAAEKDFRIHEDLRAIVVFDQDGQAHFADRDRRSLQSDGASFTLGVGVGQADEDGNRTPVEGAIVRVFRIERDDGTTAAEPVARATTGPRGHAVFNLPKGAYAIQVFVGENASRTQVFLDADQAVGFVFDADGQAHVRNADDAQANQDDGKVELRLRVATESGRPAGGAHIQVYEIEQRGDEGVLVARGAAGEDGAAAFALAPGTYRVVATLGDLSGERTHSISGGFEYEGIRIVVS